MSNRTRLWFGSPLLLSMCLAPSGAAQDALAAGSAQWSAGFGSFGADDAVLAWARYDDGGGEALYAGGDFVTIGGAVAHGIARQVGDRWEAVGSGLTSTLAEVRDMVVFDDGSGPALFVAGDFQSIDGVAAAGIARYSSAGWEAVGGSLLNGGRGEALCVYDDGDGAALYFGGSFARVGATNATAIARWDGMDWTPVAAGLSARVDDLAVYDSGAGAELYACGELRFSGGTPLSKLARYDGAQWSDVGGGTNFDARALAVFRGDLVIGGRFTQAGGVPMAAITRWDGAQFHALGTGIGPFGDVFSLAAYESPTESTLFVGGFFSSAGGLAARNMATWNGSDWRSIGDVNAAVLSLLVDPHPSSSGDRYDVYAGGYFTEAGGSPAAHAAVWDSALAARASGPRAPGTKSRKAKSVAPSTLRASAAAPAAWRAIATGQGFDDPVHCFAFYDDGTGMALYAGGRFERAGGAGTYALARWDGAKWEPFGDLQDRDSVSALTVFDDGSGPALFVGGSFTAIGGAFVNNIARFDGSAWTALGFGVDSAVFAMTVHDDGAGPALFVGGLFFRASGMFVNSVAKWDGAAWTGLGGGVRGRAYALASFDDGSGPALFVGGNFLSVEGTTIRVDHVARWAGGAWSAVGGGVVSDFGSSSIVTALLPVDLPSVGGKRLIVGGGFDTAGGTAGIRVNNIAAWDGASWHALGAGFEMVHDTVYALAVVDGLDGRVLFAGGRLRESAGAPVPLVARWNGATWGALDAGLSASRTPSTAESVLALASYPTSGGAPSLIAGGDFLAAGDGASNHVARWSSTALPSPPTSKEPSRKGTVTRALQR